MNLSAVSLQVWRIHSWRIRFNSSYCSSVMDRLIDGMVMMIMLMTVLKYPVTNDRSMGFTKEQRLKGLKKQLRNLGYTVSKGGEVAEGPELSEDNAEVEQILHKFMAKEESW